MNMNKNPPNKVKFTFGILALLGWSMWELYNTWILHRISGQVEGDRILALEPHGDLVVKALYSILFVVMILFSMAMLFFIWHNKTNTWIQSNVLRSAAEIAEYETTCELCKIKLPREKIKGSFPLFKGDRLLCPACWQKDRNIRLGLFVFLLLAGCIVFWIIR